MHVARSGRPYTEAVTWSSGPAARRGAAQTAHALGSEARRLTAQEGLAGFTVAELCRNVGVSRRTFSNYYASKRDAVVGLTRSPEPAAVDEAFLSSSDGDDPVGAYVGLVLSRWDQIVLNPEELAGVWSCVRREPSLLLGLRRTVVRAEERDVALLCHRQGWQDPTTATVVVQLVEFVVWATLQELSTTGAGTLADGVRQRLTTLRAVLGDGPGDHWP